MHPNCCDAFGTNILSCQDLTMFDLALAAEVKHGPAIEVKFNQAASTSVPTKTSPIPTTTMANPLKRVCTHATRQCLRPSSQQPRRSVRQALTQCVPIRPFTSSPLHRQATPTTEANSYVQAFPEAKQDDTLDPTFDDTEISSLAHGELAAHRELREMVRLAAWEMPLLASLSRPFEPPQPRENESHVLRWRYTTYMGEQHPASRKVVVEFNPAHLRVLDEKQRLKLLKLAGTRYDPRKKVVKMSCESFETQAMNKRYLGNVIGKLIAEAKDPEADGFEDVPLDTRHVKQPRTLRFPEQWLVTGERRAELEEKRRTKMLEEGAKVEEDGLVSGLKAIEVARQIDVKAVEEPVMVEARQALGRGKMGKKEMGQQRGAQRK